MAFKSAKISQKKETFRLLKAPNYAGGCSCVAFIGALLPRAPGAFNKMFRWGSAAENNIRCASDKMIASPTDRADIEACARWKIRTRCIFNSVLSLNGA